MAVSRFFVDELVDGLIKLPEARQRACLFALESRIEPAEVANLTWRNYAAIVGETTPMMAEILSTQVRHFRLGYIFWDYAMPKVAAPLLQLQGTIEAAFKMPWGQLEEAYRTMVWIDPRADAQHFTSLVQQLATKTDLT